MSLNLDALLQASFMATLVMWVVTSIVKPWKKYHGTFLVMMLIFMMLVFIPPEN